MNELSLKEIPLLTTPYGLSVLLWSRIVDNRTHAISAQVHDGKRIVATAERAPAWKKKTPYVVRLWDHKDDYNRTCLVETFHSTADLALRRMERVAIDHIRQNAK
jgi:hypothetical protein